MGWLRNNWLDLLIFVLFGLVVAGIVFFLTGINPFQRLQTQTSTPPQPRVEQATPPPPQEVQPQPPIPRPQDDSPGEPVITALPIPQAPSETPQAQPSPRPQEKPTVTEAPAPQPASGSWRVAVGSFSNPQNASRLARQLEVQGYRVQLEAAGALTRVTVGPYASEEQARGVARNFAGAQVYQGARPAAQLGAQPSAAYVQVGAFKSQASADALVEKLRAEGLPVVLVKDGSLIRVRVGPLGDDRERIIASLKAMGLPTLAVP
ncbi:SPOR domain-containing protein [Calidithermus roseus]|uniref:Cell division protein FtsN n=1 Tax=Calidithermus roseus TaxID=1644118 RepID=A0A399EET4_9DEIN|nr:SPOR domain-containing protein [Calidithermus roseus]RIH83127.1 Cell division protein FtsN [Calidithermus roseus]